MTLLDLVIALVLGSYAYTSMLWRWVYKMFHNHYRALEERVKALEDKQ